jgi:hypothetical protein
MISVTYFKVYGSIFNLARGASHLLPITQAHYLCVAVSILHVSSSMTHSLHCIYICTKLHAALSIVSTVCSSV